jgi:hypothetical protein
MVEVTVAEQAERLSKRRARLMPMLAVIYLGQQVSYFALNADRTVDHFKVGAWVVMSLALLLALISGGGLARKRELRDMINDETSRAHQADALGVGFVVAMLTAIILYVLGSATPMSAREAIHVIVSLAIAVALVRFGWLERRAMRG